MADFVPRNVGDLFFLVMPNEQKVLMRVTDMEDGVSWNATNADLDDAMHAVPPIPELVWRDSAET